MSGKAGLRALDGVRDGLRGAWRAGAGALGMRNPLVRKARAGWLGPRPGLVLLLASLGMLALAAYVLYRRKKRQVAEHYNMGAAPARPEAGPSGAAGDTAEPAEALPGRTAST